MLLGQKSDRFSIQAYLVLRKLQCSKLDGLEHIIKSKLCIENNFIIHVRHNENTI